MNLYIDTYLKLLLTFSFVVAYLHALENVWPKQPPLKKISNPNFCTMIIVPKLNPLLSYG